ncbi:MAG: polysaccharide biosynthesis protein, partial [Acidobacteria bacterium]|nr:polysaccharide biosynthesis protein [Acidobacteriota bacterium]
MSLNKQILQFRPTALAARPEHLESAPSLWQRLANALVARVPKRWVSNYILSRQVQMTIDGTLAAGSFVLAHVLRFDGWPPAEDAHRLLFILPYVIAARIFVNFYIGIYRRVWRYVSINDSSQLASAVGVVSAILLALRLLFEDVNPLLTVPIGTIVIDFILATGGMLGVRLFWRVACENASRATTRRATLHQRALLVGAGDAGVMAAREITRRPDLGLRVCGFVDDDTAKSNTIIQGVKVLGKTEDLPRLADVMQVDQVIITIANTNRKTIRRVLELCESVSVPVRIIPGLYEIIGNHVTISNVRPVEIEDLLGRDAIDVEAWLEASQSSYSGRRILVTGAGGSIGRELCRQLSILKPASIIVLDKDENSVFEAERELHAALELNANHTTEVVPVICDLRSAHRLQNVFGKHLPQVVFHAAAHKHVPMMENHPCEAIKNNSLGTAQLAELSLEYGVDRFVLISTDKAINPTSVMGATKRLAEIYLQSLYASQPATTKFMA